MSESSRFAGAVLCAAIILAALGHPLLTGQVYTDTDLGNLHLPLRDFYSRCLQAGYEFIWQPDQLTGFYLHGEGQGGLFHPANLLLYRFVPLAYAFTVELLRSPVFALAGTYWFMRRWNLPRDAAAVSALLFGLGGFGFVHYMHPNAMGIVAHTPWLLGTVDMAVRTTDARRAQWAGCVLALLIASQLLLGHPQFAWLSLLAVGLYALFVLATLRRWRRAGVLVVGTGLGLLTAAIQLLPTWESLSLSHRASAAEGFATSMALHPVNLLQIVSPYLFSQRGFGGEVGNEFAVYAGAIVPLALFWLIVRGRSVGDAWPLGAAALGLAVIGLLLALGDDAGLHRIVSSLPGVGLFRAPTRYVLLFQLAGAVAAGICFADLAAIGRGREGALGRRAWLLGLPMLSAVTVAALALYSRAGAPDRPFSAALAEPAALVAGPVLVGLASVLVVAAARRWRPALLGLVLLVAADLAGYGLSYVWRTPPMEIDRFVEHWPIPPGLGHHRLNWGPPPLTMRGVRLAGGYMALPPERQLPVGEFERPSRKDASLLSSLRVADVGFAYRRRVPAPLARARLVPEARRAADPARELWAVDPRRVVLVDESIELGGGEPGRARIVVDRPGEIVVRVDAPARQMLVLSESHHAGWRASVDDEACPVIRAYGDFMGCVVEAGAHVVRFHFAPTSLRDGRRLTAAGLVLIAAWALGAGRIGRAR